MTDLVERLREVGRDGVWKSGRNPKTAHPMCIKAADRIEALSAENERLREALRNAIRFIENLIYDIKSHTECDECQQNVAMYEGVVKEYRAALGDTK